MLETAFLVVPLVTGYLFASKFFLTSSKIARSNGHKLYYYSAFCGFIGLILCIFTFCKDFYFFASYGFSGYSFIDCLVYKFAIIKGDKISYNINNILIVSFMNLTLIPLLPYLLNFITPYKVRLYFVKKIIKDLDFERLLIRSIERSMPVCFSLKCGKVYVGSVTTTVNYQSNRRKVGILPWMSGYRRADDKGIVFTQSYIGIYNKISKSEDESFLHLKHLTQEDFEIIISCDEIISSNLFDIQAHFELNKAKNSKEEKKEKQKV